MRLRKCRHAHFQTKCFCCRSHSAKDGHPTVFLKVLHYALFGCSHTVRDYLFANGVDRDTVHLNDLKFFKTVLYILVSSGSAVICLLQSCEGQPVWLQVEDHPGLVFQVRLRRNENVALLRRRLPCQAQAKTPQDASQFERKKSHVPASVG